MDVTAYSFGGCSYNLEGVEFRRLRVASDPATPGAALGQGEPEPQEDGPPGVIAGISPFYPPGSLGDQVRIPDYVPQSAPGVIVLRRGSGPHVYMVHGLPGVDVTQALIAPLLAPCHVCALIYDEDAWKCPSIPKLARLLCERLLQDARQAGQESEEGLVLPPLAVTGCSFGCVIAHEMALQLHEAGLEPRLVLFSLDASWPPMAPWPPTAPELPTGVPKRPKNCEWLGGDVETALLAARASGATEWAQREVERGASLEAPPDADDVLMRVFWEHARHFGVSFASFNDFVNKAGRCSERLRMLIGQYNPRGTFQGRTEFVMTRASWADVPSLFQSE